MGKTTFSGPVISNNGIIQAGSGSVINLTAETTLTFDTHAGRTIEINDACLLYTSPSPRDS